MHLSRCSGAAGGDPAGCHLGQRGQGARERGNSATNAACSALTKDTQLARFFKEENYIKEIHRCQKKKANSSKIM